MIVNANIFFLAQGYVDKAPPLRLPELSVQKAWEEENRQYLVLDGNLALSLEVEPGYSEEEAAEALQSEAHVLARCILNSKKPVCENQVLSVVDSEFYIQTVSSLEGEILNLQPFSERFHGFTKIEIEHVALSVQE